jgi:hypothetical protein
LLFCQFFNFVAIFCFVPEDDFDGHLIVKLENVEPHVAETPVQKKSYSRVAHTSDLMP